MARKYEVPVCTGCGKDFNSCSCGSRLVGRTGKMVPAYDARDVGPLLKAVFPLAAVAKSTSPEGNPYWMVPANQLRALDAALKAFEDEEGSGG